MVPAATSAARATAVAAGTSAPVATRATGTAVTTPSVAASPTVKAASATPSPSVATAVMGESVQVTLTEFHIAVDPSTIKAGTVRFTVKNQGTVVHAFEVKGNGIDQKSSNLNPGESETMTVDLTPGTYDTWCPIDNHKNLGMFAQLTVQ